jgi:hypothetical protein
MDYLGIIFLVFSLRLVYCLFVSCLLASGHHCLDTSFFDDFQDLEAEDFEQ